MTRRLAAHIKKEGDGRLLFKKAATGQRERERESLIGRSSALDAQEELHNPRPKGSPKSRKASVLFQLCHQTAAASGYYLQLRCLFAFRLPACSFKE